MQVSRELIKTAETLNWLKKITRILGLPEMGIIFSEDQIYNAFMLIEKEAISKADFEGPILEPLISALNEGDRLSSETERFRELFINLVSKVLFLLNNRHQVFDFLEEIGLKALTVGTFVDRFTRTAKAYKAIKEVVEGMKEAFFEIPRRYSHVKEALCRGTAVQKKLGGMQVSHDFNHFKSMFKITEASLTILEYQEDDVNSEYNFIQTQLLVEYHCKEAIDLISRNPESLDLQDEIKNYSNILMTECNTILQEFRSPFQSAFRSNLVISKYSDSNAQQGSILNNLNEERGQTKRQKTSLADWNAQNVRKLQTILEPESASLLEKRKRRHSPTESLQTARIPSGVKTTIKNLYSSEPDFSSLNSKNIIEVRGTGKKANLSNFVPMTDLEEIKILKKLQTVNQ